MSFQGRVYMTAEIAILNKNAVALAADSAVTIQKPGAQKIYNTANKLFTLSKYHPVGIMVYGTAELMGIPWETLIKIYREELRVTNFKRLIQFAEHFIAFLENNRALFPEQLQASHLTFMCDWVLSQVQAGVDAQVQKEIKEKGAVDDEDVTRIVATIIQENLDQWEGYRRLNCFPQGFEDEIIAKYKTDLNSLIDRVFSKLPISDARDKLLRICSLRMTKDWWSLSAGGVVIAGFGKDDIFPVVQSYTIESIVHNRLKNEPQPSHSNDMKDSGAASIIPFAQAEIVHRFIRG